MNHFHYYIFYTVYLVTAVNSAGKDINSNMLSLLLNYADEKKVNNDIVKKINTMKPVWFLNVVKNTINGDALLKNSTKIYYTDEKYTKMLINDSDISSPAPTAEIITNGLNNYDSSISNPNNIDMRNKAKQTLTDKLTASASTENITKELKNMNVDNIHNDVEVVKTAITDITKDSPPASVNKIDNLNEMADLDDVDVDGVDDDDDNDDGDDFDLEIQGSPLNSTLVMGIVTNIISDALSHYDGTLFLDDDNENIKNVIELVRSRLATLPLTCDFNSNDRDGHNKSIDEPPIQKIEIKMYYESMCPYSRHFFSTQFVPVARKLSNYLDWYIYPFGNSETIDDNGLIKFRCTHGPAECYGNKLHACALDILGYGLEAIFFNDCLMDTTHKAKGSNDAAVDKCGKSMAVNPKPIKECAKGSKGTNLLKEYGKIRAQTSFDYVPFILIDGKEYEDEDLVKDVCDLFKTPPNLCKMLF